MTSNRDRLIELLIVSELSNDQRVELSERIIADEAVADEVLDQMWLEPLLRDQFSSDPDAFVRRVEAALDGKDEDSTQFAEQVLEAWTDRAARRSRRRRTGLVGGGVAVILLALSFFLSVTDPVQEIHAATVRIQHVFGSLMITNAKGDQRDANPGAELRPGDTLTVSGESSATLQCSDGSRVTIMRDASLSWRLEDQSPRVVLHDGTALVRKEANERIGSSSRTPVIFETQHATVEASDSQLLLATTDRQTDVTVTRGQATFQVSGGQQVTVKAGECALAKHDSMELRRGIATPDEWSEDFEDGLPKGWTGHAVDKDLPAGSRGAVGTAASVDEDGESCHQIWSHSQWEHGLAAVHPDTVLHFVYRFKKADRVQIMTLLRSAVPDSPVSDIRILQPSDVPTAEQWWNIPSGQWYVASIPLSRLSHSVTREHPSEADVAIAFNFRPQDYACGLVIDRMSLTRGESGRIEFRPLNGE